MAKTNEELNTLKDEVETVSRKLHELTDEELKQVTSRYSIVGGTEEFCLLTPSNKTCLLPFVKGLKKQCEGCRLNV